LKSYKTEIIPYFEDEAFDLFCSIIESNVIPHKKAVEISNKVKAETKFENIFSYLYKLGLVGIAIDIVGGDSKKTQKFLPVGEKSLSDIQVPELKDSYYLIHSLVDETLKGKHGTSFYNRDSIIGNNYSFQRPRIRKEGMLHVHFGLHRDSLSLILPELVKFKKIALICTKEELTQRYQGDLRKINKILLQSSNNDQIEFYFKDNMYEQVALELWEKGKNLFVMGDDKPFISKILIKCDTISMIPDKNYDKNIGILKQNLINRVNKVYLYICQREPADRNSAKKQLSEIPSVEIKDAFTDRLLFKEECFEKDDALILNIKTESYGSFIYPERENSSTYQNTVLLKTKIKEEHNYYRDRQKYLVNGIYCLMKITKMNDISEPSPKSISPNIFNLFFDIQIKRLLEKHKGAIRKIFSGMPESDLLSKLEKFCQDNKERFSQLSKIYNPIYYDSYVDNVRPKNTVPNESDFYKYVRKSSYFTDTPAVIKLKNLLKIGDAGGLKSVFISYSFKDEIFAKKLHDSFIKRGVKVFLFQKDDPNGPLKDIMKDGVNKHDVLLFIASKDSIKSSACHVEITEGRKKHERTWSQQILLPIRIDNYVLDVRYDDIPEIENKDEMWANIGELKKMNIRNFSQFNDDKVTRDYENSVDTLVSFLSISSNK
ncbi:MAG: toll/interleukin-1 receptor domain-containing protein, partial [Nitrosopumilus sp.]|nr:toll/interleukin-1 receptor domain-containing protein [Nitrosopumilus sp.]